MKTLRLPLISLLLAAFGALLGGCSMNTQKNSAIPWSRPANWEGQIPGMGTTPGSGANR
jgi:hypothetical protein